MTTIQNIILGTFILILGITLDAMDLIESDFWSGGLIGAGISIIFFLNSFLKRNEQIFESLLF